MSCDLPVDCDQCFWHSCCTQSHRAECFSSVAFNQQQLQNDWFNLSDESPLQRFRFLGVSRHLQASPGVQLWQQHQRAGEVMLMQVSVVNCCCVSAGARSTTGHTWAGRRLRVSAEWVWAGRRRTGSDSVVQEAALHPWRPNRPPSRLCRIPSSWAGASVWTGEQNRITAGSQVFHRLTHLWGQWTVLYLSPCPDSLRSSRRLNAAVASCDSWRSVLEIIHHIIRRSSRLCRPVRTWVQPASTRYLWLLSPVHRPIQPVSLTTAGAGPL